MKLRLFIWTCIVLALVFAAYLLSDWVALTLYYYTFSISPSTSFGKATVLLLWFLLTYIIAYVSVRRKWRPFSFKRLFIVFLILAAVLISTNILVFNSMFDKAGGSKLEAQGGIGGRPIIIGSRPEAVINYSSSALWSTHSLKPVLYWLFGSFTTPDSMHYDAGGALYPLFPSPGLVCPIVIILTAAYLIVCIMLFMHIANEEKKSYIAWFNCLVFSLVSFLFLETAYDGGPFSTTALTAVALFSLYLLVRYTSRKQGKRWILPLIFLPLIVLAYFDVMTYSLTPRGISLYEHFLVSSLSIAAAGFYEFRNRGKSLLMVLIVFLLVFNLASFRPYHESRESSVGDDVYMTLSIDPSTLDNEILGRLGGIQDLIQPEIIARDARTVMISAGLKRAGVSTQDLASWIVGGRVSPLAADIMFRLGNPSTLVERTIYLPTSEVELRQALPSSLMIQIDSITEISGSLTRVDYTTPQGLNSNHYLVLLLDQEGLRLNDWIYPIPLVETSTTDRIINFVCISLPITHLQGDLNST